MRRKQALDFFEFSSLKHYSSNLGEKSYSSLPPPQQNSLSSLKMRLFSTFKLIYFIIYYNINSYIYIIYIKLISMSQKIISQLWGWRDGSAVSKYILFLPLA